jgi:SAM-dependent methyltransferase
VVDVGAGTGKFTRLLLATGAHVVAVEPVAAMRAALEERSPGVMTLPSAAEAIDLPDAAADVVSVAQAFHWFDGPRAVEEFARILRPGGHLALIWNTRDVRVPWLAHINDLMDSLAGDGPRFRSTNTTWRAPIDDHPAFGPLRSDTFDHLVPGVDADVIRARVASTSYVSALPDDERERVLDRVQAILEADDGPLATEGPTFTDCYRTELFWCRRR